MTGLFAKTAATAVAIAGVALFATSDLASRLASRFPDADLASAGAAPGAQGAARASGTAVVLPAARNGHFFADTLINGARVRMMVDTGASLVSLSEEDAARAGIRPFPSDYKFTLYTANGIARGAEVTLREVELAGIRLRDVRAVVLPRGLLASGSLLGMSFLSRLSGFETGPDRMVLKP
ncbi:TIGR02281 family clan AA aspartic protease [Chelatococcus sp. SYSU_G07232]|uniref:TIGR02281 family clan AA aspartic protease n=1 Tax=Chelatococcus albus TaxID=3047466 RepID=A0ABT7AE66_9HYPH|nr:TIGR02281 family clan AA aspartic protease [Chelatococcus sp. SYSU_G07232]MDJ1157655.1 TIGR02281 family clan AA aspartic protease [Chelatococcus sp. SYSU_G07232]